MEVQPIRVFRILAVVHREFRQRRNRVTEAELDVVTVVTLLHLGVELAHLHFTGLELKGGLVGCDDVIEIHLLAHHRVVQHSLLVDFIGIGQLRHVFDQQLRRIHHLRV